MFAAVYLALVTIGADAVYFSMANLRVTIPTDRGKPALMPNHSLAVLFVQDASSPVFYSTTDASMTVSSSGSVFFSDDQLINFATNAEDVSATIHASSDSGADFVRIVLEKEALDRFDCSYIVEDLCFWKEASFRVRENTMASVLGTLSSPYLRGLCPDFDVAYRLLDSDFGLIKQRDYYGLKALRSFDREDGGDGRKIEVLCRVENAKGTSWNVSKSFELRITDLDDNAPQAQEKLINFVLPTNTILKEELISPKNLIFHDSDNSSVNNYEATVLNDTLGILEPQCEKIVVDDVVTKPPRTVIICKLRVKKTFQRVNFTYAVALQLNDSSMVGSIKGTQAQIPIHLHFPSATGHHPTLLKRQVALKTPSIYPSNKAKVFRTAAPFARITQPDRGTNTTNFTLQTIEPKWSNVFNATSIGGIIYVVTTSKLKQAPEYLRINVSWLIGNVKHQDEIEVHIIDEQTKTCANMTDEVHEWDKCATYSKPGKCTNASVCALGTGGAASVEKREKPSRCMWRGERKPSPTPEISHVYSTCTPDSSHCPDAHCDPLEELHPDLCPQDCSYNIIWPTRKNAKTQRGIGAASGVCSCDLNCQCDISAATGKANQRSTNATVGPTVAADHQTSNKSEVHGVHLAHCGTTCVLGIVAGALFLGSALVFVVICWRLDRVHKAVKRGKFSEDAILPLSEYTERSGAQEPMPLSFDMNTSLADNAILSIIKKYAPDPRWEVSRSQLCIEQTLGEGEFGRVLRAKATNIAGQAGETTVAVKTLKEDARETELNDLLSEYQLLKEVSHPNVIRLLGVCTAVGGPIYLIIEFAEHGSLRNYLRRSRHLKSECGRLPTSQVFDETEMHYDEPNVGKITPKEILSFAWQICKGMAYLSEIKLVHRDLAARNVLLAADKVCKISDFGLTRDIYEDDAYFKRSKGRVPVKWMAPESLSDHIYTNKSDVWSFGILVWELVTLGATPYPGIAVQNIFHLLRQGYRMERPDNCTPALYSVMRGCWELRPEQRPSFRQLTTVWERMLADQVDYLDLANNAIHNRSYFCAVFNNNPEDGSDEENDNETNPLNYLSKSQSYTKCGTGDKLLVKETQLGEEDNRKICNTQAGYETPVKVAQTNDCPQDYTDMAAGKPANLAFTTN